MNKPAVVVVGFNRPDVIEQLLVSIRGSSFEGGGVPLVISIDKSESNAVYEKVRHFDWPYGDKRIIPRESRLGLRKHILACGDLTAEYGSIILLEDDLVVSPHFYEYSRAALEFYEQCDDVSGISLYSHQYNPLICRPFHWLEDDSDVWFLQFPSSWGQAWTAKQWQGFREWYEMSNTMDSRSLLPKAVLQWPESSWLKYFALYMVQRNQYFVYPKCSLTTNTSAVGTHNIGQETTYQVPLRLRSDGRWRFVTRNVALGVYDAYFELSVERLKRFNDILACLDLEVDLYGSKELSRIESKHLISSKACVRPVATFGRSMWPHESNVLFRVPGNVFSVGLTSDFSEKQAAPLSSNELYYLRQSFTRNVQKRIIQMFFDRCWQGLLRRLRLSR